ncbi:MAG TPA: thioredoxin fold domain-containing protein, partial [Planctomycetota bacterium]|nr:thioredoxin fold domain-containing protein [Planctomycetota bacterium]
MVAAALLLLLQVSGVEWRKDYDAALLEANKNGRFVVVVFGGPDCPPCAKMRETTFRNKEVVDHVNKTYLHVYVDLDGPNPVARQFGVEVIPTVFLVTSDGTRVRKWEGYLGPEEYRKGLDAAVASYPKIKELEASLKLDPDSLELNTEAARCYEALGRSRASADSLKRVAGRTDDARARARVLVRVLGQLYFLEVEEALNGEILAVADEVEKLDPGQRGEATAARARVAMNREKPEDAIKLFEEVVEKHPTCDKAAA